MRSQILERTRGRLRERLGLDNREVDSVIGLIQSRLHANISTLLRRRE
jgi:hypothetical protein